MHKPEPSPGCGEQPLPGPGLFSSVHCHLPCTGNTHWLPGTFTEMKSHLLKQTNPLSQSQSGTLTHRCPGPTVAGTLTLGPVGRPGSPAPPLPPPPGHGRPGQAVGRTERWAARCGGRQADSGWMVGVARLGIRGVLSAWSSSFLSPWGTLVPPTELVLSLHQHLGQRPGRATQVRARSLLTTEILPATPQPPHCGLRTF